MPTVVGFPALACCLTSGNRLKIHSTSCAAAAHLLDASEVARQHGGRGVARRRLPPLRPLGRPPRPLGGACCGQCRRQISDTRPPLPGRQLSAWMFAACPQPGQCTGGTGRKQCDAAQTVLTLCRCRLLGRDSAAGLFAGPRHGGLLRLKVGILIGWCSAVLGCICRPWAVKSLTGDAVRRYPVQGSPSSYSSFQIQLQIEHGAAAAHQLVQRSVWSVRSESRDLGLCRPGTCASCCRHCSCRTAPGLQTRWHQVGWLRWPITGGTHDTVFQAYHPGESLSIQARLC